MSEFKFPADLSIDGTRQSVTALNLDSDRPLYTATQSHPNFEGILAGLRAGDPNVWDLFDIATGVMSRLTEISDRYSWDGSNVLFDGDVTDGPFEALLARTIESGDSRNYTAVAKFGEKLAMNPSEKSKEQLFRWLASHKFQITPDGDVVGYKSVGVLETKDDGTVVYQSGFASQKRGVPSAFVNGVPVPELSRVPQSIGDVVSLPRSEVVDDENQSCARGLHVGTENYWGGWSKGLLEVHVHPRDFVSTPINEDAKARVCRYKVARLSVKPDGSPVLHKDENVWAGDVSCKV